MSSTFNPDLFMQTTVEDANSTTLNPVPEGEYAGVIKKTETRVVGQNARVVMDVTWGIDDPSVVAATGIESPTVRQSIWLDVTEQGGLDMGSGKNVGLGRLREALGQNVKGKPWSPANLVGSPAKVKVTHTADKNDSSIIYANVSAVTKL